MSAVIQLPAEFGVAMPAHEAVAAIDSGRPYACVLAENAQDHADALSTVLAGIDADGTRVVRISNPLNAPLTIERLLIQAVGPHPDLHFDDSSVLIGLLASAAGSANHVLLVIEQADTLDSRALHLLISMLPEFQSVTPTLQILFIGGPGFEARLAAVETGSAPFGSTGALQAPGSSRSRGPLAFAIAAALLTIVGGLGLASLAYPELIWPRTASAPDGHQPAAAARLALKPAVADAEQSPAPEPRSRPAGMPAQPASLAAQPVVAPPPAQLPAPSSSRVPSPSVAAPAPSPASVTPAPFTPASAAVASPVPAPAPEQPAPAGPGVPVVASLPEAASPPVAPSPSAPTLTPQRGPSVAAPAAKPAQHAAAHPHSKLPRSPAAESDARQLRRSFDQFLIRSGEAPSGLTRTEREALFQEYLARRRSDNASEDGVFTPQPPPQ